MVRCAAIVVWAVGVACPALGQPAGVVPEGSAAPAGVVEASAAKGLGSQIESPHDWTVLVEPSYWYAAPRGDVTLPASVGDVSLGGSVFSATSDLDLTDVGADDPGSGLLGRVHVAQGLWRFTLGGAGLGTSGDGTATTFGRVGDAFFAPGDRVDAEFDFWAIEATVSYAMFHGPKAGERGDPARLRYMLELVGGARVERVEFSLDVEPGGGARPPELGLSASGSEVFAQPIGGVRLTLDLFEDVRIEVGGTVGYFTWSEVQTSSTWDVMASISWRPVERVGVQLGYRFLGLSGEADDDDLFEYRGSSAGLFAGLAVEF